MVQKLLHNKTVAIVGGGPGGLTLAQLLQQRGVRVNVYERDASREARVQGAPLDLHHDSGLKALEEAGLMEDFWAKYHPGADRMIIVDKNAQVFLEEFSSETLGPERPEIDRGPLRNLLLDSLEPDTVVWDRRFRALTRADGAIRVEFVSGPDAWADIVIGADGANSRVRPYVTSAKPIYSGVMIVEGTIDNAELAIPQICRLMGSGKICALGDSKALFVGTKGDGSVTFYIGCLAPEDWPRASGMDFSDKAHVLNWFQAEFAGWGSLWEELIENAELPFIPRPQYVMLLERPWKPRPDLTLLGDAAHVMPPYAGEGVNVAMLDALELAKCLTNGQYADTGAAIAAYEANMRVRASAAIQTTMNNTRMFYSPDALPQIVALFQAHLGAKEAAA